MAQMIKKASVGIGDKGANLLLKTPKGMLDIKPEVSWERKKVFDIITNCFESHGACSLDTPVCERREILAGKYGEESKLIYNLEDQGGELLSLRYDLTVPFARYLGQNKIKSLIRYHIAKVYRRDNPSIIKGRLREFYQCDIDFAGTYESMMPDSECIQILCEILDALELPCKYSIKVNHRGILEGILRECGVPDDKFKTLCSSIDKLDKMSWDEVKREMCNEKQLEESLADVIGAQVLRSGSVSLIEELLNESLCLNEQRGDIKKGLEDLKKFFACIQAMGLSERVKFDLSLARGLDYYTGIIYEAVIIEDEKKVEVGSIAAGGRYDKLVSSLLGDSKFDVPCVGLSIGVERLFAILEQHKDTSQSNLFESKVHCYVGSKGEDISLLEKRYEIINALRSEGLRVKNFLKKIGRPLDLYQACESENVPFAVLIGKKELENNTVNLKIVSTREGQDIDQDKLADILKDKLRLGK